ncbi:MAG: DUF192 domain-containing protein [Bacilli bacterium]
MYIIINNEKINIDKADSFFKRLKGLMFVHNYKNCLLISKCNSIHTFFMKFNINIVFLDKNYKVLKLINDLSPFKIIFPVKDAYYTLETKKEILPYIKEDDILNIKD